MVESQGRLQANGQEGAMDQRLEQGIAEAEQAVEAITRRPAIASVGAKFFGNARVDQHLQAVEVGTCGGSLKAEQGG